MEWTHEHVEVLAAVIVSLAAVAHLIRAAMQWTVEIGPYSIPQWVSWIIVLVTGYVAVHFWRKILTQ